MTNRSLKERRITLKVMSSPSVPDASRSVVPSLAPNARSVPVLIVGAGSHHMKLEG